MGVRRQLFAVATGVTLLLTAACAPSLPGLGSGPKTGDVAAGAAAAGGILDGVLGSGCGSLLLGWAGLMGKFGAGMGTQTGLTQADLDQLQQLGAGVPDELKPDFKVLGDAISSAMGKSGDEMSKALDTPETQAASDHIQKWIDTHCAGSTTTR